MNFYEIMQLIGSNFWIYGGSFVLVLSILVFVHEWGHYIAARLCGVRVEVFSIGFGRELFGYNDKHGTRWKFCLIPLGGYVKLFGDVDPASVKHSDTIEDPQTHKARHLTKEELKVAFFAKPVWQRALVVFAGPGINYVFAIILMAGLFMTNGQPITPPSVAAVIQGSSAEQAGFQPGDTVISIDGNEIRDFEDIRREMMIGLDGKKHFSINRDGKLMDLYAIPKKIEFSDRFGFKHSRGLLGVISPRHALEISTIRKVDGKKFADEAALRQALSSQAGKLTKIEIARGPEQDVLVVRLPEQHNAQILDPASPEYDLLFVADVKSNVFVKYPPLIALKESLAQTWQVTRGTLEALWQMVAGARSPTELGGVIRIGALAGDMAQQGVVALLLFTALLSINLGLVNLFPIPILDGGHLVFYAVEAAIGRPIPDQIQEYAFRGGLVFLVGIMVYANLNDIMQLIL